MIPTPFSRRILAVACLSAAFAAHAQDTGGATPVPTTQQVSDAAKDEAVQLAAFNVNSTTIGTYHEESSAVATKVPTDLKELAGSLQILNASAIADRNAQTLPDIFAYVVGATQSQNAINGFSFRGFPNTGTFTQNIEFDGLMGATLKKGASSSANVENLQFLKGPNSVLYGQMNPGGLLNIVTKNPLETEQNTLHFSVGTYDGGYSSFGSKVTKEASIDSTGPIDKGGHLLYRLVVDASDSPPSRPGDSDKFFSLYPSVTYKFSPVTSLTIKGEMSQDKRRQDDGLVPIFTNGTSFGKFARWTTAPFNTVYEDPTDTARDRGDSVSTLFKTQVDDWNLKAQTRSVWHTDWTHELTVNNAGVYLPKATFATPNTTLQRQYNLQINGHRYNFFDVNGYRTFGPENFQNTVLVGAGGGLEFSNNTRWAFGPNVLPAITLVNPVLGQSPYPADKLTQSSRQTTTSMGEYLTDQIRIWEKLHVSAGLRHDQNISHGNDPYFPTSTPYTVQHIKSTTGQFGVVYDITNVVSGYASWSQSVVPNSITSIDASGNNSFPPGKGLQYEGGFKVQTPSRNFFMSFAAYYIERTNVLVATTKTITDQPPPLLGKAIFRLDGAQHSEGLEWEGQYQPYKWWQVSAGVALGKAFVAESAANPQTVGEDLIAAPRGSGNFWTRYNVPGGPLKGLGIGTGVIYVGKTWSGDLTSIYYTLPGFTRVDSAVYYKWGRTDWSLTVRNALNRHYINSAQSNITVNPGELRTLTLQTSIKF